MVGSIQLKNTLSTNLMWFDSLQCKIRYQISALDELNYVE